MYKNDARLSSALNNARDNVQARDNQRQYRQKGLSWYLIAYDVRRPLKRKKFYKILNIFYKHVSLTF